MQFKHAPAAVSAIFDDPNLVTVDGRLVVRRNLELNKKDIQHPTLFDSHRLHAFFTTSSLDTLLISVTKLFVQHVWTTTSAS